MPLVPPESVKVSPWMTVEEPESEDVENKVPEISELGIEVPTLKVPVPPLVFTYPLADKPLNAMVPELLIPEAAVMAPLLLTVKRLATERAALGAVVPIPTLDAKYAVDPTPKLPVN